MGVIFGMEEGTSGRPTLPMPNFTPIGATCRPCGAKKTQNRPLSKLNTGGCAVLNAAGKEFELKYKYNTRIVNNE